MNINLGKKWLEDLLVQAFTDVSKIIISESEKEFTLSNKNGKEETSFKKPLNLKEALFEVNRLLTEQNKEIYIEPSSYFNPEKRLILKNGVEYNLTQKESEILEFLARKDDFVEKNILLEEIWGYSDEIITKTLETHIYKLKAKLGENIIISSLNKYKLKRQM